MAINPLELFFKRTLRDIQRKLEGYPEQVTLDEISRFLSDRGITTISAQEIFDRLSKTPDAILKQYSAILQEIIKDNLEEIQNVVALETSMLSVKTAIENVATITATRAKQDELIALFDTAWNIEEALWIEALSVTTKETFPLGIEFNIDGTKMYTIGQQADEIDEYDLITGFNLSTATWLQALSITAKEGTPWGIHFSEDGVNMYIVGNQADKVQRYILGVAWDISSAVWESEFVVTAKETLPYGVYINPSGYYMFIIGNGADLINKYILGTAWDITTAVWNESLDISGKETNPYGIEFSPSGTRMYHIGTQEKKIHMYTLTIPWNMSTATYSKEFSVFSKEGSPIDMRFSPDGENLFTIGLTSDEVNRWLI